MDSAIRKRALRSAAKVAFGASICWGAALSGCGGKSVYGDEGTEDAERSGGSGALATGGATGGSGMTGGSATAGGSGGGRLPELACTQPIGPLDGTQRWDAGVFACCAGYLAGKAPLDAPLDVPGLVADASAVNCCSYIVNSYYELTIDAGAALDFPFAAHSACCHPGVLGEAERDESFCMPWGPPVPPALLTELEAA